MKRGILKSIGYLVILLFLKSTVLFSEDQIQSVPLINLEELSPTFEEEKDELDKNEYGNTSQAVEESVTTDFNLKKNKKIFINLKALDKITAKTSSFKIAIGDKKFFGPLEIKALKCQLFEGESTSDTVAYLQVKDLSIKDNNRVYLFNGWTFASSPTLQSIDHPVYDLWITGCDNV